jgi:hypothetical protein
LSRSSSVLSPAKFVEEVEEEDDLVLFCVQGSVGCDRHGETFAVGMKIETARI